MKKTLFFATLLFMWIICSTADSKKYGFKQKGYGKTEDYKMKIEYLGSCERFIKTSDFSVSRFKNGDCLPIKLNNATDDENDFNAKVYFVKENRKRCTIYIDQVYDEDDVDMDGEFISQKDYIISFFPRHPFRVLLNEGDDEKEILKQQDQNLQLLEPTYEYEKRDTIPNEDDEENDQQDNQREEEEEEEEEFERNLTNKIQKQKKKKKPFHQKSPVNSDHIDNITPKKHKKPLKHKKPHQQSKNGKKKLKPNKNKKPSTNNLQNQQSKGGKKTSKPIKHKKPHQQQQEGGYEGDDDEFLPQKNAGQKNNEEDEDDEWASVQKSLPKAKPRHVRYYRRPSCNLVDIICQNTTSFVGGCTEESVVVKRGFVISKDRIYVTLPENKATTCFQNQSDHSSCCKYIAPRNLSFGICPRVAPTENSRQRIPYF